MRDRFLVAILLIVFVVIVGLVLLFRAPSKTPSAPKKRLETPIAQAPAPGAMMATPSEVDEKPSVAAAPEHPEETELAAAPQEARKISPSADTIAQLKLESLQNSLTNLLVGREYSWPATLVRRQEFEVAIPLPSSGAQGSNDWTMILSNRRVAKLLEELVALPKDEAGRLVAKQIRENLQLYDSLVEAFDATMVSSSPSEPAPSPSEPAPGEFQGGFAVRTTQVGDEPELPYVRMSLLSLAFIAGDLGLTEAGDAVSDLVAAAAAQRDWFYAYEEHGMAMPQAWAGLALTGLYHPGVLTTALAGTGLIDQEIVDEIVPHHSHWREMDLTPWDAYVSVFEERIAGRPDFSRTTIPVRYATEITDEQFDELVSHVIR